MAHVIFYEKPGCGGNARQRAALAAAGHTLEVRDLLAAPWTPATLAPFLAGLPVADWFNPAAPRIKGGGIDPAGMDAATALAPLAADPLLIRRPLLQVGEDRRAGFDPAAIAAWIGLGSAVVGGAVAACHKGESCPTPGGG